MTRWLCRWLHDDGGQDLVEYVLLAATVGVGSFIALQLFPGFINAVYTSWDNRTQDIWEPQDPQ
jgi:hypothetical protein